MIALLLTVLVAAGLYGVYRLMDWLCDRLVARALSSQAPDFAERRKWAALVAIGGKP